MYYVCFMSCILISHNWFYLFIEAEEEHNWIFSADQLEDDATGMGCTMLQFVPVYVSICVIKNLLLSDIFVLNMTVFSGEDSEWHVSENPSIGQSNGDHDLARTVLEVGCEYPLNAAMELAPLYELFVSLIESSI